MNAAVWALDMNLTIFSLFFFLSFFFKHFALTVELFVKTVPWYIDSFPIR